MPTLTLMIPPLGLIGNVIMFISSNDQLVFAGIILLILPIG